MFHHDGGNNYGTNTWRVSFQVPKSLNLKPTLAVINKPVRVEFIGLHLKFPIIPIWAGWVQEGREYSQMIFKVICV